MGESSWNGYERNCLFANLGDDRFADIAPAVGGNGILDGRGAVSADLDGDGKLDLVVNNNAAAPTVFVNELTAGGNWIVLDLEARQGPVDALGARVLISADGRPMTRWVSAGSGYASQSPYSLHFGLGAAESIESIEISWPSGSVDRGRIDLVNRRLRVVEGEPIG